MTVLLCAQAYMYVLLCVQAYVCAVYVQAYMYVLLCVQAYMYVLLCVQAYVCALYVQAIPSVITVAEFARCIKKHHTYLMLLIFLYCKLDGR